MLDEWLAFVHQEKEKCSYRARAADASPSEEDTQVRQLLDAISVEQTQIAAFMQECVCEIVLRDLEQLMERYLRKMRKSFSRMYWDEDQPDV